MALIKALMVVNINANEMKNVIKQLQSIKEIKQISTVAGIYDLILEIIVEQMEDLNDLIVEKIDCVEAIKSTETFIVLKDYKWFSLSITLINILFYELFAHRLDLVEMRYNSKFGAHCARQRLRAKFITSSKTD